MKPIAMLGLIALLLAPGPVPAAPEGEGPEPGPWQDYPVREIDRPELPPAHGLIASLFFKSLATDQALDQDGEVKDTDGKYNLLNLDLWIGYGITDRVEIYGGLPYITGEIGETSGGELADVYAGARVSLFRTDSSDLAAGIRVSFPTGDSSYHYERLGSGLRLQNFRTGDPSYDYYPELAARATLGDFSLRLNALGVITDKGEVDFNRIAGFNERLEADPGDGIIAGGGLYYQATERLVPGIYLEYTGISETRIDGKGLRDDIVKYELKPAIMYQHSQEFEVELGVGWVFAGRNTPLGFPVQFRVNTRF